MAGRFIWASTSDIIGRRNTYMVFFTLGIVFYALIPSIGHMGSVPLFVGVCVILLSMYGGGFAAIPAYLRDVFGTMHVGAIHGYGVSARRCKRPSRCSSDAAGQATGGMIPSS